MTVIVLIIIIIITIIIFNFIIITSLLSLSDFLYVSLGMKMSNASLLDESTAGAEAMSMCFSLKVRKQ